MSTEQVMFQSHSLAKKYGGQFALKDVSLTQRKAKIYGLIGQNGAGKTTLMRIIAGLSFPTSGSISLFGNDTQLDVMRKNCGFMIESAGINNSMSARDNLRLHGIIKGIELSNADIEELLHIVGLKNTKKKARGYSLGMKQRLSIALALIGYPRYLVLDEPINGLDPQGVVDIRNLIVHLCTDRGITILISSHNLPELYQAATDYIIIHQGTIAEEISLQELEEKCQQYVRVESNQPEKLAAVVSREFEGAQFAIQPDGAVHVYGFCENMEELAVLFQKHGLLITSLAVKSTTLEQYFLSLIGGGNNAKSA